MKIEELENGKLYILSADQLFVKLGEGNYIGVKKGEKIYIINRVLKDKDLNTHLIDFLLPNKEQKGISVLHAKSDIFEEYKEG